MGVDPVLRVEHLTTSFRVDGKPVPVVRDLSFTHDDPRRSGQGR